MAELFRDRRLLVLLALGFSAGVPLPLTGFTLRQWFSESGVSLAAIGLTALIGLAYALKFLWSPVLDHAPPPPLFRRLGQRRGWLACIQPLLIVAIAAMGFTDPTSTAAVTAAVAVLVAFLSASQDVVIDAYRIEILEERQQGYGLACYIWGYRFALLASNAGALALVATLGWDGVFLYCAALVLVGLLAVLLAREPARGEAAIMGWGAALQLLGGLAVVVSPILAMFWLWGKVAWAPLIPVIAYSMVFIVLRAMRERLRAAPPAWLVSLRERLFAPTLEFTTRPYWLVILLFVVLFKLGEALAGIMTAPFYRELGFTRMEVAGVASGFGLFAALAGALVGGFVVSKLGTGRALIATGILQMLSNLMYVALAETGRSMPMLWAQVGVENFTDGLADAAFVTYLSMLTSRSFTATQYALLSSLAAVPLRTLAGGAGWLAAPLGWSGFFLMTTAAALPAMAIMIWLIRRLPPDERRTDRPDPAAASLG